MAGISDNERAAWLRLARTPNIGPVTFFELMKRYRTPSAALDALPELSRRAGRKRPLAAPPAESAMREIEATRALGGDVLTVRDLAYPLLLQSLAPPPPVISIIGNPALAARPTVAIVGSRNASAAGRKLARDIASQLGAAGQVIVSGLARGVDGEAHAASLRTGTIAVLGGGADHVYPPQHAELYDAISRDGLIISESPLGHQATARDFPRRNRIITGCALGLVVVEASERSGSLISARTAGEQGREVMAVPGSPLDPRAAGTNRLLRDGATLVRNGEDVLDALAGLPRPHVEAPPPPDFEGDPADEPIPVSQRAAVLEALAPYPMPIDDIARTAGIGAARCAAILVELELAGEAQTLPGGLAGQAIGT